MTTSDRAHISARIDTWLSKHALRKVIHNYCAGYHQVSFIDERGNETRLVSRDSREDAARLFLNREAA